MEKFEGNLFQVKETSELPDWHVEGLDDTQKNDLNIVGQNVFENYLLDSPGYLREWCEISGGGRDAFAEAYRMYVEDGHGLAEENPDIYGFIKDHVFYGTEYENIETKSCIKETPEGYVIVSGDPEEWAEVLDWSQGDNELGFLGDCGLVSCENILRQAGIDLSETDVVKFAAENGLCAVTDDPNSCGATTAEDRAAVLTKLGIQADATYTATFEDLANAIEDDRGVIVSVNAGILWDEPSCYGFGESNHAITLTGVERDAVTGEIKGFYICDSGRGLKTDGARFLSLEEFAAAHNVLGSSAVITQNPIKA